ncbi:hypothetical protein GCM10023091_20520 [Ravibacter arvi]|uniref:Uncharacterized protein n=1 Tax=Ravibacter arvi TaxID=2051041 RepID=A0ABP8LYS0_9BACT
MKKVDVCVNYYGKPYQTAVTLLTLWKHSSRHINKIFLVIEKIQPYYQYHVIPLLKYYLRNLPVTYVYPRYFYYAGNPDESWLTDPEKRYGLKYQYALEHSDQQYLFMTHNDCLYEEDLLGNMLQKATEKNVAGIGLVGQCWNCPAFKAQLCDSTRFENFIPSRDQLKELVDKYNPPRAEIHYKLIGEGLIHPLPECRLNEYACLINVPLYQQNVVPKGDVLPFGGSWHGTDWGAIWFHSMVNKGYRFINFPFEPLMKHAPFSANGSGHRADSENDLYNSTEDDAKAYLTAHHLIPAQVPGLLLAEMRAIRVKYLIKKALIKLKVKIGWD